MLQRAARLSGDAPHRILDRLAVRDLVVAAVGEVVETHERREHEDGVDHAERGGGGVCEGVLGDEHRRHDAAARGRHEHQRRRRPAHAHPLQPQQLVHLLADNVLEDGVVAREGGLLHGLPVHAAPHLDLEQVAQLVPQRLHTVVGAVQHQRQPQHHRRVGPVSGEVDDGAHADPDEGGEQEGEGEREGEVDGEVEGPPDHEPQPALQEALALVAPQLRPPVGEVDDHLAEARDHGQVGQRV
mmetsp:Transcript_43458/g.116279  ORF Transcript_43458/g.116279 Transcript_43458/m.116279 type:complete len:242 (+) Transcript_43458:374-1099(+)